MTNQIIHDPTRGWLLLTPDGQIEIAKEDWDAVVKSIPDDQLSFYGTSPIQDHHPYSVDAEFEVKEQYRFKASNGLAESNWFNGPLQGYTGDLEYRQIARLVKAKQKNDMKDPIETGDRAKATNTTFPDFKKFTLLNPTDSVTSDGTHVHDTNVVSIATEGKNEEKPTESQNELWQECYNECYIFDPYDPVGCDFNIEKAKASFKIERI